MNVKVEGARKGEREGGREEKEEKEDRNTGKVERRKELWAPKGALQYST